MKEKKQGITLIALIITIVILLILATISVNIAIKGDLFGKAGKAVDKTNNKIAQEQEDIDELLGQLDKIEGKADKEHNKAIIVKINDGIELTQTAGKNVGDMLAIVQRYDELVVAIAGDDTLVEENIEAIKAELKQLLTELDIIANDTIFDGEKLLDGTFNRGVGINELVLQIDDLSSSGLGLEITEIDSNLASAEAITEYINKINTAIYKIRINWWKIGGIQNALEHLKSYYNAENNIIDSATINMDKEIAKIALSSIKKILQISESVCESAMTESYGSGRQAELDARLIALDHIANNADFNGQKLLDGTFNGISKIDTTILGEGTKLSTDISTTEKAGTAKTQYEKAIEMVDKEIAKLSN